MKTTAWAALVWATACGGDGGGGPTSAEPGEISCDIDGDAYVFGVDVQGSVSKGGLLVLDAGQGLVSLDTAQLIILDEEGESDLADPFVGTYLGLSLGFDAFTSRNLKGTATATLVSRDRAQGTFVAEVVNDSDPRDVRIVTNGEFDVPLTR